MVILKPEYFGCYFATLVGCWSCGALEQLELSCGGRLAAHIVGGQAEALGRAEGGPEFHPGAELLKRVGGWAPSPPPTTNPFHCNPVPATLGALEVRPFLGCLPAWWTNDHKWWRPAPALVQHIPGYYWCTVGAPDQDTIIAQNIKLKCSWSANIASLRRNHWQ